MSLFDKIKSKYLQEKKKNDPGDALRKAIGKQSELDAAKDFQKDIGKNITPELKNTLNKKKDNLNRFFTDKPDSETLKAKPTGDEKQFKSKVKFDSGAKGKFPSGSPDLGGTQRKFVKDRRRKLDTEINKRRSAELTKADAINRSMGGGPSTEGSGGANQGSTPLKKGKPFSKAESDAIQTRSLYKKTKQFVNKPGTTKSKGSGAFTGGQKNLVVNPKSKGTTPVTVSTTKTVKQSDISKKAKKFTAKINKANVNVQKNYVGRKAVRIKDATLGKKTGSLRKGNLSFPGDRSGAYQATKSDIEARKGFKGAKTQTGAGKTKTIPGLKADEKNPFVKTTVRKGRAAKLGGDIYDQPKFSQKVFDKSFKGIGRNLPGGSKASQIPIIPDPFKASTTKTGSLVKNFKFQPRDVSAKTAADKVEKGIKSAKKSFSDFSKKLASVTGKKTNVNISPTDAEIASLGYDPRKSRTVDKKYAPGTKGKVQMRGGATNIPAGPKTPPKKYNIPADDRPGKLVQGRDFASKKSYDAKLEKQIKILRGKADNLRKKQIKVAKTSPARDTPEYKARSVNVKKIGRRMKERTKAADALERSLKRQGTTGPTSMLPVVSGKGADAKMPGMGGKTYKQFYKDANVGAYQPPKVKSTPKPPPVDPNIEDTVKKTYKKASDNVTSSKFYGKKSQTAYGTEFLRKRSRGFSGGRGKRALAGKVGRFALKVAKKNPLLATLAVAGAGIYGYNKARKAIAGPQLTSKDFTGSVIKDRKGKNVVFKNPTYNPATKKSDTEHRAGGYVTQKQLNKFKTGDYNISDKSGNKIDLDKRIKQSAFTKQLTKASKGTGFFGRQTQKDKDFLKKYKKAAEYRGIAVK